MYDFPAIANSIQTLAEGLLANSSTMAGPGVARYLNNAGLRNAKDQPYVGGRGIYTVLERVYLHVEAQQGAEAAKPIALAFVNSTGRHAWAHRHT